MCLHIYLSQTKKGKGEHSTKPKKTLQHLERFWYFDLLVNAGSCGVNQNSSVWMTTRPQRANTKKHWDLVGKGKFIPFHHTHLNHLHLVKRHVLKSGNQLTFTTIVPHCSSLSTTESNITKNKTKKKHSCWKSVWTWYVKKLQGLEISREL